MEHIGYNERHSVSHRVSFATTARNCNVRVKCKTSRYRRACESEETLLDFARLQNDHTAITMREVVTESENLTVNEIVRAKEIFEREITEHYIAEALRRTKNENGISTSIFESLNNKCLVYFLISSTYT